MSADQPVTLSTSLPLNGRTALVTGGFSGLGWHFAHVLAQAGAQVEPPRESWRPVGLSQAATMEV